MVVIDVAMTETARLAHYVLPAATQFEKPEATFFNLEFPHNTFHLRHPLLEPLAGHPARARDLGPAGARARRGRRRRPRSRCAKRPTRACDAYAQAFLAAVAANPTLARCFRSCCTRRWDRRCPTGWPARRRCGGWRRRRAMTYPDAVRRAGHADGNALFEAILDEPLRRHVHRARYEDDFALITPRRPQDRPGHARDARRDTGFGATRRPG